jgi:hypothetical protein
MQKRLSLFTGVILLSVPGIAVAKDKEDARIEAMLACEGIAANEARLQCFDQAITPLKQALTRGTVVVEERNAPLLLEGVVKTSGQTSSNRYWLVMENGDRWALLPKSSRPKPPAPGSRVKMKKTLWGGYWLSGPGWAESEAAFLGHGS